MGHPTRPFAMDEKDASWQPESTAQLVAAIARLERLLPGWWWSTGSCSVSAHASIGPDRNGQDKGLLEIKTFDDGFHADLEQPSTCGEALNACINEAIFAQTK